MLEALLAKGNPHLARSLHDVSLADGELTTGWCAPVALQSAGRLL